MDQTPSNSLKGSSLPPSSSTSTTKEQLPTTVQGRLVRAKSLKLEGNDFFEHKEWKRAVKKYHHSLMYCKGITDKLDFIPGLAAAGGLRATQEEEREATNVTTAVTNNLAGWIRGYCILEYL